MNEPTPRGFTTTLLAIPRDLYDRIVEQAKKDRRTARPEMLELLEEAVTAREKRAAK